MKLQLLKGIYEKGIEPVHNTYEAAVDAIVIWSRIEDQQGVAETHRCDVEDALKDKADGRNQCQGSHARVSYQRK